MGVQVLSLALSSFEDFLLRGGSRGSLTRQDGPIGSWVWFSHITSKGICSRAQLGGVALHLHMRAKEIVTHSAWEQAVIKVVTSLGSAKEVPNGKKHHYYGFHKSDYYSREKKLRFQVKFINKEIVDFRLRCCLRIVNGPHV
eukprot:1879878-Amphidinium_carterae.1